MDGGGYKMFKVLKKKINSKGGNPLNSFFFITAEIMIRDLLLVLVVTKGQYKRTVRRKQRTKVHNTLYKSLESPVSIKQESQSQRKNWQIYL